MGSPMTSTDSELFVAAATPATFDAAGYAALTWVKVGQVTDIPPYGPTRAVVTTTPLDSGDDEKYGGTRNNGSSSVTANYVSDDAGQIILRSNVASPTAMLSFKVLFQDGSIDYNYGKCFSATKGPGSANAMVTSSFNLEFNKPLVEVAAP